MNKLVVMPIALLIILTNAFLHSCADSKGTSTGNPLVNLRYGVYSGLATFAITEARFCFKRVRFKQAGELTSIDPVTDEDNIDFSIGEKVLNTTGDNLGNVAVPPGNYERIEFDLDNSCGTNYSVRVINSNGTFSTDQHVSIKFIGNININNNFSVELALQNLITQLNTVTLGSEIKTKLEAASGAF